MSIKSQTDGIGEVFIGTESIGKVYAGTELVWLKSVIAPLAVDYLVVAGGGGGGAGYTPSTVGTGGGGGAGGLKTTATFGGSGSILALAAGTSYTISVGAGGGGGAPSGQSYNGGNSQFESITSTGGGRGGMYNNGNIGGSGGSGGGTGYSGQQRLGGVASPSGQGNNGGVYNEASPYSGSGGGGAGSVGGNGPSTATGGLGLTNSITGTSTFYAAGGGGGKPGASAVNAGGSGIGGNSGNRNSLNGTSGSANTGSGGGGAGHPFASGNNSGAAGSGSSGVVILKYPSTYTINTTQIGSGLSSTNDHSVSGYTITTIICTNSSTTGTGTLSFTSSPAWGTRNFNTVLWNGDGASSRDITGAGFNPDFVWIKKRQNDTKWHRIFDTVRGVGKVLYSNSGNGQASPTNELNGFIVDGFNVGNASAVNDGGAGDTFAAWTWRAGGAAVSNTDGNTASMVSANVAGGFSIVTHVGNGVANATIGHGLNGTPDMVITKSSSSFNDWGVAHVGMPNKIAYLQSSNAAFSGGGLDGLAGYQSAMTSTTFGFTGGSNGNGVADVNKSNENYVAYCWKSIPGYSKFDSYVGNGSTNGPIVNLGFEPAFLMFKCVSIGPANWIMIDNKRATSNPRTPHLRANTNSTDDTGSNEYVDFTSTGFQPKGVSNYNNNSSNQTYIYMAFAAE